MLKMLILRIFKHINKFRFSKFILNIEFLRKNTLDLIMIIDILENKGQIHALKIKKVLYGSLIVYTCLGGSRGS